MNFARSRDISRQQHRIVYWGAVVWMLYQFWFMSPLPYQLNFGLFNSTEGRSISLAFAVFLSLTSYPLIVRQRETNIKMWEVMWALLAASSAGYLYLFYDELSEKLGVYSAVDLTAGVIGLILLIDAARRAIAVPIAITAIGFIGYAVFGAEFGEHQWNASLERIIGHFWLTTEGVFGITLGLAVAGGTIGVFLGTGLDKLAFGERFVCRLFQPYSYTDSDIIQIPRWLKGRFWTWVFAINLLGAYQYVGLTEQQPVLFQFLVLLLLFLACYGGKSLINFTRIRIGERSPSIIWGLLDGLLILGLLVLAVAAKLVPSAIMVVAVALPVIAYRQWRRQSNALAGSVKVEIETSVIGSVLVALLSSLLSVVMIGIGYLADIANLTQYTLPSTVLISVVLIVVAVAALILLELKNTSSNYLPLALFLVIVANMANGNYIVGMSPGLSAFHAAISGVVLVVFSQLAFWSIHKNRNLRNAAHAELMEIIDWLSCAGRNAVPVVILAATLGIIVGAITLTGLASRLF